MNYTNEESKLFKLYTLAELVYIKNVSLIVNNDIENIFPKMWYQINDYKLKIEIISEAIKNNILIQNTIGYQNYIKINQKRYIKE